MPAANPSLIQNTVLLLQLADWHRVEEYAPIRQYKRRRRVSCPAARREAPAWMRAAAAADDGPVDEDRGVSGGEARGQGAWRPGSVEECNGV